VQHRVRRFTRKSFQVFAAGAYSHASPATTRIVAVARANAPVDTAEEQQRLHDGRRILEAAHAAHKRAVETRCAAEHAETAAAERARILELYGGSSSSSESEGEMLGESRQSGSGGPEVWEIWGDPREVRDNECLERNIRGCSSGTRACA
jgi:hypothetical protein